MPLQLIGYGLGSSAGRSTKPLCVRGVWFPLEQRFCTTRGGSLSDLVALPRGRCPAILNTKIQKLPTAVWQAWHGIIVCNPALHCHPS